MSKRASVVCVVLAGVAGALPAAARAQGAGAPAPSPPALSAQIRSRIAALEPKVVAWRRDIHQHPELGNREVRTSRVIQEELRKLGYEVTTGVAHTGVVAILKGAQPGPVVALRADMDALPVTEQTDLPFKSTATAEWNGQQVGVMHACGHDTHMAMLLGAATVFSRLRDRLPGTVKLIFQPAEEGAPEGEEGGAALMVEEGVLANPAVDAIFGLHAFNGPAGTLSYRSGPFMASSDTFTIRIRGRQTHGAVPWGGVDPIVIGAQIVTSLQTIVSRHVNITEAPAVVTVALFHGGVRSNIVPDHADLGGTIRTFSEATRTDVHRRVRDIAAKTAEAAGGSADVNIRLGYPVTVNDAALTERMVPTLRRVAGDDNVNVGPLTGTAEDFSYYQQKVPGLFVFLGVTPRGQDWRTAPQNHSPYFFADESALPVGVRVLAHLAVDYMAGAHEAQQSVGRRP
jgi:amidohydrolase